MWNLQKAPLYVNMIIIYLDTFKIKILVHHYITASWNS